MTASAVIRAFGLADAQVRAFRAELDKLYGTSFRFNLWSYLVERTPNVSFLLLQVAILAIGSVMAYQGSLRSGRWWRSTPYRPASASPSPALTRIMPLLLEASGGVQRISCAAGRATQRAGRAPDAADVASLRRPIEFDDVSFATRASARTSTV